MNDIIAAIKDRKFHAVNFYWKNIHFTFSGWWLLEWDDGTKGYDSIDEFLSDRFFENKTLEEIAGEITDIDVEYEA